MSSKHRIGFDLEAPLKFFGLTKDEIGLFFLGFVLFVCSSNKAIGAIGMLGSLLLVVALKRFKKRTAGFRIGSFIYWHLGWVRGRSTLPPSFARRIN